MIYKWRSEEGFAWSQRLSLSLCCGRVTIPGTRFVVYFLLIFTIKSSNLRLIVLGKGLVYHFVETQTLRGCGWLSTWQPFVRFRHKAEGGGNGNARCGCFQQMWLTFSNQVAYFLVFCWILLQRCIKLSGFWFLSPCLWFPSSPSQNSFWICYP